MRRQGYPGTLSELDKWYPAVPDSQNNARIYERAFALPGFGHFGRFGDIKWPDPGPALSARDKKELMELVMANQGALALLHSAQASNRSHYSFDLTKVFSVSTGRHINVLNGVLLLGAEALVHADNGDSQQAIGSFMAAGMLADSLAEEPFLIAQIVRDGGWNITARRLEHAMALTQLTEEQLALLQVMVERAEQPGALLRGLAGERAMGIAAFADPVMILQDRPPYNTTECLKNDMIIGSSKSTGVVARRRGDHRPHQGVRRVTDAEHLLGSRQNRPSMTAYRIPAP